MDSNNMIPIHEQISMSITEDIRNGTLRVNEKIPSEHSLMEHFSASRGTIRRALKTLSEQGYVSTLHGKGTFVATNRETKSIASDFVGLGELLSYSSEELKTKIVRQETLDAKELSIELPDSLNASKLLLLERIRFLGDLPVAYLKNWINIERLPELDTVNFTKTSLLSAIEKITGESGLSGTRDFKAVLAPLEISEALCVSQGYPLQFLHQVTYLNDSEIIEFSDVWMDSNQIKISVDLVRKSTSSGISR